MEEKVNYWFKEDVLPAHARLIGVDSFIYNGESPYQKIEVIKSPLWGKCLILDGNIQSAEFDEYIYHESLVHPAMVKHPEPKTIMVAGGGEGAILREILKHPSVEKLVMVDLDKEVVDVCQKYLPEWSAGSFNDPRVNVSFADARKYLENSKDCFDIIFMDLPEPLAGGPCYLLYTKEFYQLVARRLNKGGAIALQADYLNAQQYYYHGSIAQTIGEVFQGVYSYNAFIPSYGTSWGFIYASNSQDPLKDEISSLDRILKERAIEDLKFYDGLTQQRLFTLTRDIRQLLKEKFLTIKDANPLCRE